MLLNLDKISSESIAAIDSEGEKLTYGDIVRFSTEIKQIIPNRELVFVLVDNNTGGIAWIISTIMSKIVPLILNVNTDKELLNTLIKTYKPKFICSAKEIDCLGKIVAERYGYIVYELCNESCKMNEELSHLLPTSGSTGSPKLVRHKYSNIEASALNISTFFELNSEVRPLLVLPLYYTMGLSIVFSHLYVGATILITNLSMTDKRFWNFMKEEKATSFTGVPYSFEILNMMRFFRMELPDLELLTQGGGKMPSQLNLKFAEYCQNTGKRWIATYGQSEGTARMAYLPPKYAIDKSGSIGYAVPNGRMFLLDDKEKEIKEANQEGEMCYEGKNVTMGYARKQEDLQLGDENKGFLRTGDLAYFDEDGCFFIVGRKGRFLKLFGMRVGLDECEQIIKAKYPIECACVGDDNKMTVYITNKDLVDNVKKELVSKTKIVASAFDIKVINEIPKNQTGKILYRKLNN